MTGGEAVIRSLEINNISTIFGIPGSHNLSIYNAISRSNKIKHILCRHEQGAVLMADGYSRASGKIAVCLTTTGPASLNTLSGVGTSYTDSIPILIISSQNPTFLLGKEKGLIHELSEQVNFFKNITTISTLVDDFKKIPEIIGNTITEMLKGRNRPGYIEIPYNILETIDELVINEPIKYIGNQKIHNSYQNAINLINSSKKPIILSGGGVISSNASYELLNLSKKIDAPVFTTVLGKGSVSDHYRLSAGSLILHPEGKKLLDDSDLLIAVGTRFTEEETESWSLKLPEKFLHIDIDKNEIGKNYTPTDYIIGDAKIVLQSINAKIIPKTNINISNDIKKMKNAIRQHCIEVAPSGITLVDSIRKGISDDSILVSDLTLAAYWCRRFIDVYKPRTNLYPWGFGTLGYSLPAAIGAKCASPNKPVIAIMGDGGFMFNSQEILTSIQENFPIIILIFNDNSYGVLKFQQESLYGNNIGVNLNNPDFVKMGESYGIYSERVNSFSTLEKSLTNVINKNKTCLIEITEPVPWPVMHPTPVNND